MSFDLSQVEGVSPELLAKVQQAVDDVEYDATDNDQLEVVESPVPSLLDMPTHIQNKVPAMAFEVHIFATDGNGWVRVNGRERYEGDVIAGDVVLTTITQDSVVLELRWPAIFIASTIYLVTTYLVE